MPITLYIPIRPISQSEFGDMAYEVMRHVFNIHNELGRFFDEKIYKRELARRMPDVRLEEPIDVTYETFSKRYWIDVLVCESGLFEFKAVARLAGKHRAQLLHYLMLCGAAHGKLINIRPVDVEHEFVNSHLSLADRVDFSVQTERWNSCLPGAEKLSEFLIGFLRHVGAGLDVSLYEEAAAHCFGGIKQIEAEVMVEVDGHPIGHQRMRLIAPDVALKVTTLDGPLDAFETHALRLLSHVTLRAIAWVNVNRRQVTFTTLERQHL